MTKKITTLMIIIIVIVRVMLGTLFLKIIYIFFKRGIVKRAIVSTFGKSPVTLTSFAFWTCYAQD